MYLVFLNYAEGSISNFVHILREDYSEFCKAAHKIFFLLVNILWSLVILTPIRCLTVSRIEAFQVNVKKGQNRNSWCDYH